MSHDWFSLDELAQHLGRDRREIEKLANRGRIPGRKMAGDWQFHPTEITHWLEQEMREYTDRELAMIEQTNRTTELSEHAPVSALLSVETIEVSLQARTKRSVLETLVEVAGRTWQIWQPAVLLTAIQEREAVLSTAFENGVAIPHPRNPLPEALGQSLIAFGRSDAGIPFGAPNRGLTDLFFLVLCRDSRTHLHVLARLGRLMQQPGFLDQLRGLGDPAEVHHYIAEQERQLPG